MNSHKLTKSEEKVFVTTSKNT